MAQLHVIFGPMFAGKTEELQRLARRAVQGGRSVLRLIPAHDVRSAGAHASHAGRREPADAIDADDPRLKVRASAARAEAVFLDEGQMLGYLVAREALELVNSGVDVTIAGLLRDYRGEPFSGMALILANADAVTALTAVCVACQRDATHTHRRGANASREVVGGAELYEPRCRACWLEVVRNPYTLLG